MKELRLSWRNLWRNRKRTLITATAVTMAVILSTVMSSMQEGTYSNMIDNSVKFYSGYIQIMDSNYWDSRSINDAFTPDDSLYHVINSVEGITFSIPRLESFTLISSGENTQGCALIGIDPEGEDKITRLSNWVKEGSYLQDEDEGLLLAVNVARNLEASVGDTLVLISQGYHGSSAAALIPVRGILNFPSPEMNSLGAYITIKKAQEFYDTGDQVTSIVVMMDSYREVNKAKRELQQKTGNHYNIMTWDEMQPDLVNLIQSDRSGAVIMKGVLYLVVGFGVLGTIIMMMSERKKELGVMIAVGMKKNKLKKMLLIETIFMGLLGVIFGFVISLPLVAVLIHYPIPLTGDLAEAYESFGIEPVLYFSMMSKVFVNQAITIFGITLLIAVYPVIQIQKWKALKLLRS